MLVPSGNLQEWIDNQNKQVRSESDIKIEVFSHSQSTCTLETTLTKKNLQNFNISESGSVLGFETPSVNISFIMFKDGVNENLISIGSFIRISYGYLINGSWSWVEKGVYEISVAKVQNNGLTAQYQAKFLRYQALEQEWDKGGTGTTFTSWLNLLYEELKKFDPYLYVPSPVGTSVFLGYGSFGSKSILGMATALHQVLKGTLVVHQELSSSRYSTAFVEKNIKPTDAPDDTYIISYSNQFKKYEIVDEDYWDDVSIWEHWAIYDESSLIKLTHSITIKAYLVKNSNMDAQYEGYYPYNFASLSVQPVPETYSGSLGSGDAYVFGNKIILKYPNSTLDDDLDVRITYPYVKCSKQLSAGSGNSLLELDNPFVSTAESSDRVSVISHSYLNLMRAFFNEWKDYQVHNELNVRFDPRLEIFDNIIYADSKNTFRYGFVESIEMSYNGSFKAKIVIRDIGSTSQYQATFVDINDNVLKTETLWKGETPTPPTAPTIDISSTNAVYISRTFSNWSPNIAPIQQDTTYKPVYDNEYRLYNEADYFGETATFFGQLLAFTQRQISSINMYRPHIADLYSLIGKPSLAIPTKTGHEQSSKNDVRGDDENDKWQNNRVRFVYANGQWTIRNIPSHSFARWLCLGQDNRLWFATPTEINANNLTIIQGSTVDELLNFKFNPKNNTIVYDPINNDCQIYKETT